MVTKRNTIVLVSGTALLGLFGAVAQAQTSATPINSSSASSLQRQVGLEEVVVVAERRSASLQRTPIAISVLGVEALQERRIVDLADIAINAPGFTFLPNLKTQLTLSIRGAAALDDSPGMDQGVGIFVDEIYIGQNAAFAFDLFDIERIEVLKGPQGTIFGKNVVGGALNIITRNPTDEPYVNAELTHGRFGMMDGAVSISGPLIDDSLAGLVSFSSRNSDGSVRNLYTGNRLEQDNMQSTRGKLKWNPSSKFEALLAVDYARDKSFGIAEFYFGPTDPVFGAIPGMGSHDTAFQNTDGYYDRKIYGSSLRLNYDMSPDLQLTSVTGYRGSKHHTQVDADGTHFSLLEFVDSGNAIVPAENIQSLHDIEQFSQELRVTGETPKLEYIAGIYYYTSRYFKVETQYQSGAPGSFAEAIGLVDETEIFGQSVSIDSYAGFAQGTYSFTDALRLTAGARYTREKKHGRTFCDDPGGQCQEVYDVPVSKTWGAWTPKLTLDADITEDTLGYATISRGFKSGGFVSTLPTADLVDVPFDPEYAMNYEAGLKTRLFDNRLQVNVAVFHVKYSDLQVREFTPIGAVTVANAGSARVNGIEVDFRAKPIPSLELFGSYSYLDGEYEELVLGGVDLAGNQMVFTPEHSLTFGGAFTADLGNGGRVKFETYLMTQGRYFVNPDNDPNKTTKYDNVLNGSVIYTFPGGQWSVQLWAKNILDEQTRTVVNDFDGFFAIPADQFLSGEGAGYSGRYNERATYGVTARYTF